MIIIEVSSDGKGKLFSGGQKTTFERSIQNLFQEKYKELNPAKGIDFLFFSPEMKEDFLVIKMTIDTDKNIFTDEYQRIGRDTVSIIKKWAETEYGKHVLVSLLIQVNNHTHFFH